MENKGKITVLHAQRSRIFLELVFVMRSNMIPGALCSELLYLRDAVGHKYLPPRRLLVNPV